MANPLLQTALGQQDFSQDHQLHLILYLDQEYAGTRKNQEIVQNPKLDQEFGKTLVNDWPIYDGPDPSKANIVARARGHHIQTCRDFGGQWFLSCSIVFLTDSCFPGSTLVVTGMIEQGSYKGEWAIVGGTGKFNLARGAIFYDILKNNQGVGVIKELHIGVLYTPMPRPTLSVMFSEFNPSEVDDATDNGTRLGIGGYGSVYKAELRKTIVAIKTNDYRSKQGRREFDQEVEILRHVRHENLVKLIGVCSMRLALIYEFLPNGTLEHRLAGGEMFSWVERIRVAMSICSALEFLHNVRPAPIAHGDLKPSNILFDERYVCKLGDFGISRPLKYRSDTATPGHTTKEGKGTMYYIDPEFIRSGRLTPQSDVYAFGIIIMLQLVTGRDPPENLRTQVEENLSEHLVDTRLNLDDKSRLDAMEMMRLGLRCSNDNRRERPDLATEECVRCLNP